MKITWDSSGLVPAIVQDECSHEVLMLAYMNAEALSATLETGIVHFYSRSRSCLWKKGETSGNILSLVEIRTDCDSDAILVIATPAGPTCHTEARSCFFRRIDPAQSQPTLLIEDDGPEGAKSSVIERVYRVLCKRRDASSPEASYTRSLLDKGFPKIEAKIAEESGELIEVLADGNATDVVHESVDLLFHVLVGLCARHIEPADLWTELQRRFGIGGHTEKASRSKVGAKVQ